MKVLVVSDTHGRLGNLKEVLEKEKPLDMLVHCGDVEGSEKQIRELAGCPVHMVAGNNDFFSDLPREDEFCIGKYRVLLTHGHYYYISMGTEILREEAQARGFQIAMFGHTHRPFLEEKGGVTVLNPGSLSYPRQEGRRPSYLILELDEAGEAHFTQHYL